MVQIRVPFVVAVHGRIGEKRSHNKFFPTLFIAKCLYRISGHMAQQCSFLAAVGFIGVTPNHQITCNPEVEQ